MTVKDLILLRVLSILCILVLVPRVMCAQAPAPDSLPAAGTYVYAGFSGFIPMRESYRLNYSTNLAGFPIEVMGGFIVPISPSGSVPFTARYERREADFLASTSIRILSIEPGFRYFLEAQREKDVRVFGAIEALFCRATVESTYDQSRDGTVSGTAQAQQDYYNIGFGVDIGASYPLATMSGLDATVHVATYLVDPVDHGGLGNIGGVSIGLSYRHGF